MASSRVRKLCMTLRRRTTANSASRREKSSSWSHRSTRTGTRERYAAGPDTFRSTTSKFLLLFRRLRNVDCGNVPTSSVTVDCAFFLHAQCAMIIFFSWHCSIFACFCISSALSVNLLICACMLSCILAYFKSLCMIILMRKQ